MSSRDTIISTWFVADDSSEATYFPQLGARSDSPEGHRVYWRCTVCFFASSLRVNPNARHMFFTNVDLPRLDGIDLGALFDSWNITVVRLPVIHRLPVGSVSSWGNQFYVFDVIDYLAAHVDAARSIILDSDCIWLRGVDEAMTKAIDQHGMLTLVEEGAYLNPGEPINGVSRVQMTAFLSRIGGAHPGKPISYFGGEIFAATQDAVRDVSRRAAALWPEVVGRTLNAPDEEAHLLSIIAAMRDDAPATANPFIRRMWTSFKHNTVQPDDVNLTIWHLPAEKRSGFGELYNHLLPHIATSTPPAAMPVDTARFGRFMGVPRRSPGKFFADGWAKIREKIG